MKPSRPTFCLLALACACALSAGVQAQQAPRPRPAASDPAEDCTSRWEAYRRSQVCYARFLNANGTLKPGARAACGPALLDPSPQCGLPVN